MYDEHRQLERLAQLIEEALAGRLRRRELLRRGLALGLGLPAVTAALAACGVDPPDTGRLGAPESRLSPWHPTAAPASGLSGRAEPIPSPAARPVEQAGTAASHLPSVSTTPSNAAPASSASAPAPSAPSTTPAATRFAVIGDYGLAGEPEAAVAAVVASWSPEFVVTTGDNNYPDGSAETIDRNVGQYYSQFITPYRGQFGAGAAENRFWPVLGNHDWVPGYPEPYLAYFSLPGNRRYYHVERGHVGLFCLDSMPGEPDGSAADSAQAAWLQAELAASQARWKVVSLHHSPYSSGHHGSSEWMRWPFAEWGVRLVLGGHDHTYERVQRDGITYVVNGLGGGARYARGFSGVEGSQVFFNADHGAMLIEADAATLRARFVTRAEQLVDEFSL